MKTSRNTAITLIEVFPRDGFQALREDEWRRLDTAFKIELCERLAACGIEEIEAASFAHPQRLPQLADAAEVIGALNKLGSRARALVPNMRGLERALEAEAQKAAFFLVASETYQLKNVGMDVAAALREIAEMKRVADLHDIDSCVALGTVFVCPYEGRVSEARVRPLVAQLAELGFSQITLADTTGTADSRHVDELCTELVEQWRPAGVSFGLHLHDAHGLGLVNVVAGLKAGVTRFETSLLGIGAGLVVPGDPRSMGNVRTAAVLDLLQRLDLRTAIDSQRLQDVARWADERVSGVNSSLSMNPG